MSEHKLELAVAFLQSHPDAAAAILEQLSAEDVVGLLQDIPQQVAADVLERVLPQYSARLCRVMQPEQSAVLLAMMNFNTVSAVLRYSSSDLRKRIIELLPEKTRLACLFLLSYTEDTVGAWMIIQAASVPGDNNVEQALKSLLDQDELVLIDTIFIVDRNRTLLGELSYASLLRAKPDAMVASLVDTRTPVIFGATNLETALKLDIWENRDSVAIVNRQNQFVGVLRHVDLRRGIAQIANMIDAPAGGDPITSLLSVYGSSLYSLLDTVGDFASTRKH